MEKIEQLRRTFQNMAKSQVRVQTAWATCKEVNWEERIMVATGVADGLDFPEVLLGNGDYAVKPEKDAVCLIGIIENNPAATFIISCEKAEEVVLTAGDSMLSVRNDGVVVKRKSESLFDLIKALIDEIKKTTVQTYVGPSSVPINNQQFESLKIRFNDLLKSE